MRRVALSWSGGKDATFALYQLQAADIDSITLITTVGEETDRSSMHGVHRDLYRRQAAAMGLDVRFVALPAGVDNEGYRRTIDALYADLAETGIDTVAFGDLQLADVKRFRESILEQTPLAGRWPIWGMDTAELVDAVIDAGITARVVAVDTADLDVSLLGRHLDSEFIDDLPPDVDPAGEGGEYHTFVTDGPMFDQPVPINLGQTVERSVGDTTVGYQELILADK